ncbi:CLUMA_CG000386, isoform A [Clunio marinus]|uniref:CLUMA_CG000386, isoform A n=1 Tax=Clunio marinus TaxID=568069 RepID=A0A1J1HJD2_9DIPT|nr:CLUMA_CG000386, isoform A [Clunio marinus]
MNENDEMVDVRRDTAINFITISDINNEPKKSTPMTPILAVNLAAFLARICVVASFNLTSPFNVPHYSCLLGRKIFISIMNILMIN